VSVAQIIRSPLVEKVKQVRPVRGDEVDTGPVWMPVIEILSAVLMAN
jgi:hypothetical protein